MNCLIIDESPTRRKFLQSILKPHITELWEAVNPREIQARLNSSHPYWVVFNLETHGLDGLKLVQNLKEQHPDNRTIVLSAYDDPDLKSEALKAGAFGFVLLDNLLEVEVLVSCLSFKSSKRSYA